MANDDKKNISRRDFLKTLGAGTAVGAAALAGCKPAGCNTNTSSITGEVPKDKMTYRTNPHTGDRVSLLGYGCMRWPMKQSSDGQAEVDQDAVNDLVDYALDHGVNYFDTAPGYLRGLSEAATGAALKRHPREKFFIATKLSNMAPDAYARSREGSIAMYRQSFERLQVDYIDYYLLHSIGGDGVPGVDERFIDNGMIDFLLREKEQGRIRNLGWSFHGDVEAFDHLLAYPVQWDFAMIQLNYMDWHHATGRNVNAEYLYSELEKKNVPAIVMEPLLGGRLSRLNSLTQAPLRRLRPDDSPAKWAFRYAGSPDNILTVLSGMTYLEHLQENIRTYSPLEPITPEEYDALEEVTQLLLNEDFIPCTECQYCMPCHYGIDIPGIFSHYNKVVNARRMPEDAGDSNYRKFRREFLIGYDRSVPKLRQAKNCIGCGICKPECPQRIPIPDQMQRIDQFVERLRLEGGY